MRLQEGLSTRRSQQQLVARTAKLAVHHGGTVIMVSIDMALCIKLCVLCIDIESFHRFTDTVFHIGRKQSSILSPLFALQNCQSYP